MRPLHVSTLYGDLEAHCPRYMAALHHSARDDAVVRCRSLGTPRDAARKRGMPWVEQRLRSSVRDRKNTLLPRPVLEELVQLQESMENLVVLGVDGGWVDSM